MPICLRSQPSCHVSLKFVGYSNLLNGDILKISNLKLSLPHVHETGFNAADNLYTESEFLKICEDYGVPTIL